MWTWQDYRRLREKIIKVAALSKKIHTKAGEENMLLQLTVLSVSGALFLSQLISLGIYLRNRRQMKKDSPGYAEATYHVRFKIAVLVLAVICIVGAVIFLNP